MSQPESPEYLAARETFTALQRTLCARRVLPAHLQCYADVNRGEVDWLGLVERVDRPLSFLTKPGRHDVLDRASVAIAAHLLGVPEALRVAPADTFAELLALVDNTTRLEAMACMTLIYALIEL